MTPSDQPASPLAAATMILLARLIDATPELIADWRAGRPILIDVVDTLIIEELRHCWRMLFDIPLGQVLYLDKATIGEHRNRYVATAMVTTEIPRARPASNRDLLEIIHWRLPFLGISPSARACLPKTILSAAREVLALPGLDAGVVARTIEAVTGENCRARDLAGIRFPVMSEHLALAVGQGTAPAECIAELIRLQQDVGADKSRALRLDQLHGLDPAVRWARSTLIDLADWRRGAIGWDAIDHGVVLDGPPGTGKTLFAKVFAEEAGLPLISCSLAQWQSRGHLGDLLKAMRTDFAQARAQAPSVMFIDELDAFGDRARFTDNANYQTQVVDGFLQELDGMEGRTGIVFVAATNDVSRCDPAIIRSGRLNRIVRIGLPDEQARQAMFRVRLGADLTEADLGEVSAATEGLSGADIQRLVNDARRIARHAGRPLSERDLLHALEHDGASYPPDLLQRIAIHESGHAVVALLSQGPRDLRVTIRGRGRDLGSTSFRPAASSGTREELEDQMVLLLAGRAAEEIVTGSPSAGAGAVKGSDLQRATAIAAAMVGSLGLAGPNPVLFMGEADETGRILANPPLREAAHEILRDAYGRALGLMRLHKAALCALAKALIERRTLRGEEIVAILDEVEGAALTRSA